jgi:hypothetical protein
VIVYEQFGQQAGVGGAVDGSFRRVVGSTVVGAALSAQRGAIVRAPAAVG